MADVMIDKAVLASIQHTEVAIEKLLVGFTALVDMSVNIGAIEVNFNQITQAADNVTESVEQADRAIGELAETASNISPFTKLSGILEKIMSFLNPLNILSGIKNMAKAAYSAITTIGKTAMSIAKSTAKFVESLISSLSTQMNAEYKLALTMANRGMSINDYGKALLHAKKLQGETSFSDEVILGGMSEMAKVLRSADALMLMSDTLMDYAAGMHGASVNASQMVSLGKELAKAFSGSYESLEENGFILNEAQRQVMTLGTEMEKARVIADVIGQRLHGAAQAFEATPQGGLEKLKQTLNSIREMLGSSISEKFTTLMTSLLELLNSPGAQNAIAALGIGINFVLDILNSIVQKAMDILDDLGPKIIEVMNNIRFAIADILSEYSDKLWLVSPLIELATGMNHVEAAEDWESKLRVPIEYDPVSDPFGTRGLSESLKKEIPLEPLEGRPEHKPSIETELPSEKLKALYAMDITPLFANGGFPDYTPPVIDHIGSVGEIGRIRDDVNVAEEDIKLLRDVAEQRYVQNFVSLRTGINMNGTTITKEADVDRVMDMMNERMVSDQESSAKGVYQLGGL